MTMLDELRQTIQDVDHKILELVKKRLSIAKQIGEHKQAMNLPVRNYQVEAKVIERYSNKSKDLSISQELATRIAETLIDGAVNLQYQNKNSGISQNNQSLNCMIIGAGKMGTWLRNFLETSGHKVLTKDIDSTVADIVEYPAKLDFDIIFIATPMNSIEIVLEEISNYETNAIITDIGSLKSPFTKKLKDLSQKGYNVTSFHPMFGPNVKTLNGRNIVIASLGSSESDNTIKKLFSDTAANMTIVPLEDHDKYMAVSLGLSHAINLIFGETIRQYDFSFDQIMNFAGTTFRKQLKTTKEVFSENPELYYQIQHLNENRDNLFDRIKQSILKIEEASSANENNQFKELMKATNQYFGGV